MPSIWQMAGHSDQQKSQESRLQAVTLFVQTKFGVLKHPSKQETLDFFPNRLKAGLLTLFLNPDRYSPWLNH